MAAIGQNNSRFRVLAGELCICPAEMRGLARKCVTLQYLKTQRNYGIIESRTRSLQRAIRGDD